MYDVNSDGPTEDIMDNDITCVEFDTTNLYVLRKNDFIHLDFKWRRKNQRRGNRKIFFKLYLWKLLLSENFYFNKIFFCYTSNFHTNPSLYVTKFKNYKERIMLINVYCKSLCIKSIQIVTQSCFSCLHSFRQRYVRLQGWNLKIWLYVCESVTKSNIKYASCHVHG